MKQERFALTAAVATAMLLGASAGRADDRATIDQSQFIGNRELPKVLYIVPWKKPVAGGLLGPPAESVLDEALAPIDRDVFRRQVQYNTMAHPAAAPQRSGEAQAVTPAPSRN